MAKYGNIWQHMANGGFRLAFPQQIIGVLMDQFPLGFLFLETAELVGI